MKRMVIVAAALAAACGTHTTPNTVPTAAASAGGAAAFAARPLTFEENRGQTDARVRFISRGPAYTTFLTDTGATVRLPGPSRDAIAMTLDGASAAPRIVPEDRRQEVANYLVGDPSRWRVGVTAYSSVRYERVYDGIDLRYYATGQSLEHDFIVSPGADPARIRLTFAGQTGIDVTREGDLLLRVRHGSLRLHKPVAYQPIAGERRPVEARYAVGADQRIGFALGTYDTALPLVIDPVLIYSTYFSGSNADYAYGIAVDGSGSIYVTGSTDSADFPTTVGAFDPSYNGVDFDVPPGGDVFVAKLSSSGALVYSTYVGGTKTEKGLAIAVDSSGNAYVVGSTSSTDFPTTAGSREPKWGNYPFQSNGDAFAFKLNAAGSAFVYSTFLSGTSLCIANGVAVDSTGAAYVVGQASFNFLTPNPLVSQNTTGGADAFVAKLSASGGSLIYATLLGGSGTDNGKAIAIDSAGNAYATGETDSTNFPTTSGTQTTYAGNTDVFATKLNTSGAIAYSTYLGGTDSESAGGIAVDSTGAAYLTGETGSANFPTTAGAFQTARGGTFGFPDAFVTKLSTTGAKVYSTYLGGAGFEDVAFFTNTAGAIAVDASGQAVVTGTTSSQDFPLKGAFKTTLAAGDGDAFVTKLNAAGTGLVYSTFLGGSAIEIGHAIALDSAGVAYVAGRTRSTNLPLAGTPVQSTNHAVNDGIFIAKLDPRDPPTMGLDKTALTFTAVTNGVAFTAQTAAQVVRMTESGFGTVTWTATSNKPWLVVSPASGTGSVNFNVSVQFASGLTASQTGTITIALTGSTNTAGPITVTLKTAAAAVAPFGSFDTPTDGSTGIAGSIAVTGWALDDVQVTRVTICRDAVTGETAPFDPNCAGQAKIYIGDAVFIDGARPDVQALFPTTPLNTRAGWGYLMLTNFLPSLGNGTFKLYAFALDADGHSTQIGTKTITCANSTAVAPFGAIDTPAQGQVTSGAIGNVGWVLSPGTRRADPPGGGTVRVLVDGIDVGAPGLWNARPDLTALFPQAQFSGIDTALGIIGIDTTQFANGVHTLAWIVTATSGGTSGVGSRFFTVSNGGVRGPGTWDLGPGTGDLGPGIRGQASKAESWKLRAESWISGRRGFDLDTPFRPYRPSASGQIVVQSEELDRIELQVHATAGYMRTPAGRAPLPAGSTLDRSTGSFVWMPGPGFVGPYTLSFDTADGVRDITIVLNPQGSNRVGLQTVIDTPGAGRVFRPGDAFFVAGWALDLDAPAGTGVDAVHVWAYPVNAAGGHDDPLWVGAAAYGAARPDVAAVYGEAFEKSSFGMTVPGLAPGTYDIAVFAFSTVRGGFGPAKVVRVTIR